MNPYHELILQIIAQKSVHKSNLNDENWKEILPKNKNY